MTEQLFIPFFSSSRISTGRNCCMPAAMLASGIFRQSNAHQQLMAFSIEASSVKGMVIFLLSQPVEVLLFTAPIMEVNASFFSKEVICKSLLSLLPHVKSCRLFFSFILLANVVTASWSSGLSAP